MILWPILCHLLKLGMKIAGTKVTVKTSAHMHRAMT
jgi:hypothetical protein